MKNTSLVAALVITTMVLVACGTDTTSPATDTTSTDTSVAANTTTSSDSSVEVIELTSSTINYDGPDGGDDGTDSLTATVSVDDAGMITAVVLDLVPGHAPSKQYQSAFANAIEAEVVGKSLDDATVGKLAGASRTSEAWNEAITELQTEFAATSLSL